MGQRPDGYDALPKRFKDYIRHLESRVGVLLASIPNGEPTNVRVKTFHDKGDEAETFLPDDTRIEFTVGRERFVAQRKNDGLEIRTELAGLAVRPEVSNVITVVTRGRSV